MTPLYTLYVNSTFVNNWTDLQLACEVLSSVVSAAANIPGANCTISLDRSMLPSAGVIPTAPETTVRQLAKFRIHLGQFEQLTCNVIYDNDKFLEVIEA